MEKVPKYIYKKIEDFPKFFKSNKKDVPYTTNNLEKKFQKKKEEEAYYINIESNSHPISLDDTNSDLYNHVNEAKNELIKVNEKIITNSKLTYDDISLKLNQSSRIARLTKLQKEIISHKDFKNYEELVHIIKKLKILSIQNEISDIYLTDYIKKKNENDLDDQIEQVYKLFKDHEKEIYHSKSKIISKNKKNESDLQNKINIYLDYITNNQNEIYSNLIKEINTYHQHFPASNTWKKFEKKMRKMNLYKLSKPHIHFGFKPIDLNNLNENISDNITDLESSTSKNEEKVNINEESSNFTSENQENNLRYLKITKIDLQDGEYIYETSTIKKDKGKKGFHTNKPSFTNQNNKRKEIQAQKFSSHEIDGIFKSEKGSINDAKPKYKIGEDISKMAIHDSYFDDDDDEDNEINNIQKNFNDSGDEKIISINNSFVAEPDDNLIPPSDNLSPENTSLSYGNSSKIISSEINELNEILNNPLRLDESIQNKGELKVPVSNDSKKSINKEFIKDKLKNQQDKINTHEDNRENVKVKNLSTHEKEKILENHETQKSKYSFKTFPKRRSRVDHDTMERMRNIHLSNKRFHHFFGLSPLKKYEISEIFYGFIKGLNKDLSSWFEREKDQLEVDAGLVINCLYNNSEFLLFYDEIISYIKSEAFDNRNISLDSYENFKQMGLKIYEFVSPCSEKYTQINKSLSFLNFTLIESFIKEDVQKIEPNGSVINYTLKIIKEGVKNKRFEDIGKAIGKLLNIIFNLTTPVIEEHPYKPPLIISPKGSGFPEMHIPNHPDIRMDHMGPRKGHHLGFNNVLSDSNGELFKYFTLFLNDDYSWNIIENIHDVFMNGKMFALIESLVNNIAFINTFRKTLDDAYLIYLQDAILKVPVSIYS